MRSRYSAYVLGLVDYLVETTLPTQRSGLDIEAIRAWSLGSTWLGLEVEGHELLGGQPEHAFVTFTARWHDQGGRSRVNPDAPGAACPARRLPAFCRPGGNKGRRPGS